MTLKEARIAAGMTQKQLSEACKDYLIPYTKKPITVSVAMISRIERGVYDVGKLKYPHLLALATSLHVDMVEMMESEMTRRNAT